MVQAALQQFKEKLNCPQEVVSGVIAHKIQARLPRCFARNFSLSHLLDPSNSVTETSYRKKTHTSIVKKNDKAWLELQGGFFCVCVCVLG